MKALIVIAMVIGTSLANANTIQTVFKKDTKLPVILQEKILAKVQKELPCLDPYGLRETTTAVKIDRVDNGVIDYYYSTSMVVNYHYDYHPRSATIKIDSAHFDYWCEGDCNYEITAFDVSQYFCE